MSYVLTALLIQRIHAAELQHRSPQTETPRHASTRKPWAYCDGVKGHRAIHEQQEEFSNRPALKTRRAGYSTDASSESFPVEVWPFLCVRDATFFYTMRLCEYFQRHFHTFLVKEVAKWQRWTRKCWTGRRRALTFCRLNCSCCL